MAEVGKLSAPYHPFPLFGLVHEIVRKAGLRNLGEIDYRANPMEFREEF